MVDANRYIYLDVLKVIAIIAVVILHCSLEVIPAPGYGTNAWIAQTVIRSFVPWCVAVFVMVSGALNLSGGKQWSYRQTFQKILRICVPLVIYGIIYNIIIINGGAIAIDISISSFTNAIKKIVFGPAWYHLWYIYLLAGLYLMTPILQTILAKADNSAVQWYIALFIVCGVLLQQYNAVIDDILRVNPDFIFGRLYFPFPEVTGMLGYYLLGWFLHNKPIANRSVRFSLCFIILSLILQPLITFVLSGALGFASVAVYGNGRPFTLIMATSIFILAKQSISSDIPVRICVLLKQMSSCVFGVYLIHALILSLSARLVFSELSMNSGIKVVVAAAFVSAVAFIYTLLIKRIPVIGRWLV